MVLLSIALGLAAWLVVSVVLALIVGRAFGASGRGVSQAVPTATYAHVERLAA